jgi:hypothetical protein
MTKFLALCLLIATVCFIRSVYEVHAQNPVYGSTSYGPIAPNVAACPPGVAYGTSFCTVGTTVYVNYNNSGYNPLSAGGVPGIKVGTQITYTETCQKSSGSIPLGYTNKCTMTISAIQ